MIRQVLLLVSLVIYQDTIGQDLCESIAQLKTKTYGFKPAGLSQKKKEEKNKQLNAFWDKVKTEGQPGLKCLQALILAEGSDTYFCWDASALLAHLDTSGASLEIVRQGLEKADLNDLQLEPYLQLSNALALKGINIENLTAKLLSLQDARVFLTAHVITLDAMEAAIFLVNTMPTDRAEQFLINLYSKGNEAAKKNAIPLLALLSTDAGDRFIDSLRRKSELDKQVDELIAGIKQDPKTNETGSQGREAVLTALNDLPYNLDKNFFGFAGNTDLISSALKNLGKEDIELLRLGRSKSTPSLSDEALSEYFTLSKILLYIRTK